MNDLQAAGHLRSRAYPHEALARRCQRWLQASLTPIIHGPETPGRGAVERYMATQFQRHYGARLTSFMPYLLSVWDGEHIIGAVGMRPAQGAALFMEQYLDAPAEQCISQVLQLPTPRGALMEIGNLAAAEPGSSYLLFMLITEAFFSRHYDWGVFNATLTVQNILRKMGFRFLPLDRANPERLGDQARDWGSYYASPSTVIALCTADAHQALLTSPICRPLTHALGTLLNIQAMQLPEGFGQ